MRWLQILLICVILLGMEERINRAAVFTKTGFSAQTIANILGMDISNYYKMKRNCETWHHLVQAAKPLTETEKLPFIPYMTGHDLRNLRVAYAVARYHEAFSIQEIAAALNRADRTVLIYLKDKGIACGRGINYAGRGFIPSVPEKLVYRPPEA